MSEMHREIVETSTKISEEIFEKNIKKFNIFNELHNSEKVYNKLDEILEQLKFISTNLLEINLQQITPINHSFIPQQIVISGSNETTASLKTEIKKSIKREEQTFIPTIDTSDIVVNTQKNKKTTVINDITDSITKLNNIK